MPEAELDDLTLTRAQPVHGGADQPAPFGPLRVTAAGGRGGQAGRLTGARFPRAQPAAAAFAAGHRVKPGPQPDRIAEAAEAGGGDGERVPDGISGAVRLAQHPAAVTMQGLRVLVVSPG